MIWVIVGTRPELIKTFPVVEQLHAEHRAVTVIATGQHTTLTDGMPLIPDVNLAIPSPNDPDRYVHDAVAGLTDYAEHHPKPDWIVVQGDTASALAGARLGQNLGIPVCHVEAGLRSFDLTDPWPEEGFRIAIDHLATVRCAPTITNMGNLLAENLQKGSFLTGNPITDALRLMGCTRTKPEHVLITLHRRESFGNDMKMCVTNILNTARHHHTPFLWPLHPNPHVAEALNGQTLPPNVQITPPMPYRAFLDALCASSCVITDSGGLVEECTTLGIPALVARNTTERPEALTHSTLIGRDGHGLTDHRLPTTPLSPSTTFGDGHSAPRITALLT